MNAHTEPLPASSTNNKPLWAAVGILGIAVLAMGVGLIYVQTRPADTQSELVSSATGAPQPQVLDSATTVVARPKPAVAAVSPAPAKVTQPQPVAVANNKPAVIDHGIVASQTPTRQICVTCGTIESVTPVQRKGEAKGIGAVAGGVLGAVVGNQVGHGSGRTAATVLGALGGGYAGNAVEKNVRKETVYQVHVRMEDGTRRTVEQATLPVVGTHVTIEDGVLRIANGNS